MKKRSIRYKFIFCLILLLLLVATLSGVGLSSLSLYRNVVRDLSWRAEILPVSTEIFLEIEELRTTFREIRFLNASGTPQHAIYRNGNPAIGDEKDRFESQLNGFEYTLDHYIRLLGLRAEAENAEGQSVSERSTLSEIRARLNSLKSKTKIVQWWTDPLSLREIEEDLGTFRALAGRLPNHQLSDLSLYCENVKTRYRTLFILVVLSGVTTAVLSAVFLRLGYIWIFKPLSVLIDGSREIAAGRFHHRIFLNTDDEMAELATALNDMTERFEAICSDLDEQILVRSREAIRNERLASVGFLAAGVAHEINNPIASIAMCSESLERRLRPFLDRARKHEGFDPMSRDAQRETDSDVDLVRKYLKIIRDEAFRCKTITEKLLDFSRTEKSAREAADLTEVILGMVEMIAHHGDYRGKEVRLNLPESLYATVNPQEMKQVVLNLLTNALDAISPGGTVRIKLSQTVETAVIEVSDDGCGMDSDMLANVFEPFYTKKEQGRGTGLGLSITHRIVGDHKGRIEAFSDGPDHGSLFRVEIPLGRTVEHGSRSS